MRANTAGGGEIRRDATLRISLLVPRGQCRYILYTGVRPIPDHKRTALVETIFDLMYG